MKQWFKIIITNFVTLLRVIGIFAIIPVYLKSGGFSCFALVALCFLTDCLDGMLARELNSSTFFGSIFDSFSDKAFLIINLLLLFTITPLALIPIILEVSIAIIQSIKYAKNMNVKSNLMGKAKMWIAGFTISGVYILTDLNYLNSFNNNFTNFLANNNNTLIIISLLILSLSELLTFLSYLKEYIINIKNKFATKVILNEELELKENIADMSLFQMLFNHDFYIKYKDNGNLKFIRNLAKIHKKA